MAIYIWIWVISFLLSLFPKCSKSLYIIWGMFLIIVAGTRDIEVGTDTHTYFDIFDTVGETGYAAWVEPLWNLTCFITYNFISSSYNIFLLVVSAITICNYFYVFYKESPFPFLSVFIFISMHIYTGSFNVMRQYYAMSFLFLSWYFFIHNKKVKSIVTLIISLFSHYSTLFSLIFIFWNRFSLSTKRITFFLFVSFIFGSMMNESILSVFTSSLFANFLEKDTVFRENSVIMMLMVIAQNALALIVIITTKKEMRENFWYKLFVLSCIVFNATYMVAFAARFYLVFAISQLVFIPLYMKQVNARHKIMAYGVLWVYMSAQFFRILIPNGNGIIPYKSILF
jgi:hypothetical protein